MESSDSSCNYNLLLQILDMTETELTQLARHLGHDIKTHKDFYRLSDSTVQLSKVDQGFFVNI